MTPDLLATTADYIARLYAPRPRCRCRKCKCDVGLETPAEIRVRMCVCCWFNSHSNKPKGAKPQIPTPHHPKTRRQSQKRRPK